MKVKAGVVGSASGEIPEAAREKARQRGRALARAECVRVSGTCPSVPHEALLGAKEIGWLAVATSPALSLDQHRDLYRSPWERSTTSSSPPAAA